VATSRKARMAARERRGMLGEVLPLLALKGQGRDRGLKSGLGAILTLSLCARDVSRAFARSSLPWPLRARREGQGRRDAPTTSKATTKNRLDG
jgi:hypothetical protein